MRCLVGLVVLGAVLHAGPTRADGCDDARDDAGFALFGAHSLCHNLSLDTHYTKDTRKRLDAASQVFQSANADAEAGDFVSAFAKAKRALGRTQSFSGPDKPVELNLGPGRALVVENARAFVRCTIDAVAVAHASAGSKAERLYGRAVDAQTSHDYAPAISFLRKVLRKLGRFL
jgi:hypothetical protein